VIWTPGCLYRTARLMPVCGETRTRYTKTAAKYPRWAVSAMSLNRPASKSIPQSYGRYEKAECPALSSETTAASFLHGTGSDTVVCNGGSKRAMREGKTAVDSLSHAIVRIIPVLMCVADKARELSLMRTSREPDLSKYADVVAVQDVYDWIEGYTRLMHSDPISVRLLAPMKGEPKITCQQERAAFGLQPNIEYYGIYDAPNPKRQPLACGKSQTLRATHSVLGNTIGHCGLMVPSGTKYNMRGSFSFPIGLIDHHPENHRGPWRPGKWGILFSRYLINNPPLS